MFASWGHGRFAQYSGGVEKKKSCLKPEHIQAGGRTMRLHTRASEGHWVEQKQRGWWVGWGGGCQVEEKSGLWLGDGHALPAPPPPTPSSARASPPHIVSMKANVLIYDTPPPPPPAPHPRQRARSETPAVVKLPWLSLKPRPNEIWMCREWIRVMEWAKYCLRGVLAILSWGDRYSGLRKVKTAPSKFSTFVRGPEKFVLMQPWWLCLWVLF